MTDNQNVYLRPLCSVSYDIFSCTFTPAAVMISNTLTQNTQRVINCNY